MAVKRKAVSCHYDTDKVARSIWATLLRDFRTSEGENFCRKAENAFYTDFTEFRDDSIYPELAEVPVGRFKRYMQLRSLLKKYRFAKDVFTNEELEKKTLDKYFIEQERLAFHTPMGPLALKVVQRARKIARSILGEFSPEDTIIQAKFGKKSSIGCPLSLAYIDEKLSNVRAFTGSSQCSRWFFGSVLSGDKLLSQMVDRMDLRAHPENLEHESLNLINVPKSWKTYRTITPLTLLSLFYSYGVGKQVTERLQKAGLDIRKLQHRHRKLVKQFSMSRTHATADLSAASDSLTSEILNRILPRPWYVALKKAMTHQVVYNLAGKTVQAYTESVLPMGNGFTFPVETLIFYCIIKAIGDLAEVGGLFSVYGDDLIYPSRLHKYVVGIFPHLKLVLNLDKTFVSYPFRESCGSDYYRGCDVRPFFLQGERELLTRTQYLAFLYKTYNGLTRRWDEDEIRSTLRYLLIEIASVTSSILRVPPGFPDTAGIKVENPGVVPLGMFELPLSPIVANFCNGSRWFAFTYLSSTSSRRFVKLVEPYYWLALQGKTDEISQNFWVTDFSCYNEAPASSLNWVKQVKRRYYKRGGRKILKKHVSYLPSVASRSGTILKIKDGFISDWI